MVLNRLKLDEEEFGDVEKAEQEKKEDGDKDPRKAGRNATSRIPTFQSSSGRKRHTGQPVEPVVQPPARVESSNLPVQTRAKGSGSGSSKVTGAVQRETALPLPLARLLVGGSDALPHITAAPLDSPVPPHKRSQAPGVTPTGAGDPLQLNPLVLSARLPIRAETEPPIPYLLSECAQDVTVQNESVSGAPPPSDDEQAEPDEADFVTEQEMETDSSAPPLPEELIKAGESGHKSQAFEEEVAEKEEAGEEKIELLEEGEETGESLEGSESEPEFNDQGPSPTANGADLQSGSEKAGEEEGMDPDVDFGLGEADSGCRYGANGGNEGPKSTGQEVAPGNRSGSRQVSELEVGEAEVCSHKPASRRVKKSQAPTKVSFLS